MLGFRISPSFYRTFYSAPALHLSLYYSTQVKLSKWLKCIYEALNGRVPFITGAKLCVPHLGLIAKSLSQRNYPEKPILLKLLCICKAVM